MRSFITATVLCLTTTFLLTAPVTEAFAPCSEIVYANSKNIAKSAIIHNPRAPVALEAYKKRETAKKPEEKEETPPWNLFIAYMTPWRNPNSIFVYLFLLVYILGSYSEAKSAAGI